MAKKRRVASDNATLELQKRPALGTRFSVAWLLRFGVAFVLIESLIVPCDSVAVEYGHAIALPLLCIPLGTLAIFYWPAGPVSGRPIELLFAMQILWLIVCLVAVVGDGNVRHAINEFWVWLSMLAVFAAARRSCCGMREQNALISLVLACTVAMSVHTLYQTYFSIPETIRLYQQDPERELQQVGIDAPAGSAIRYQFEGRLFAAEATGTYSLSSSVANFLILGFTLLCGLWIQADSGIRKPTIVACLLAVAVLAIAGMFATGSKVALAVAFVLIAGFIAAKRTPIGLGRLSPRAAAAIAVAGVVSPIVFGVLATQNAKVMAFVPMGIRFRFEYWKSTLQMIGTYPWFGAGPGNFKSVYAQFRAPHMSEKIADPHNFVMEAFAVGGIPLGLSVLTLVGLGVHQIWLRGNESISKGDTSSVTALTVGGFASIVVVWPMCALFNVAPEYAPYVLGIPMGTVFAWTIWRSTLMTNNRGAVTVACGALLFTLIVSGGWTVPGLAIVFWVLLGTIAGDHDQYSAHTRRAWYGLIGGVLVFGLFVHSTLNPVLQAETFVVVAGEKGRGGEMQSAKAALFQAISADPWSPTGANQLVSVLTAILLETNRAPDRREFEQACILLQQRDPGNSTTLKQLGDSHLKLYRRWQQRRDLEKSREYYQHAISMDVSSILLYGQLAVVLELLDGSEAKECWHQLGELSGRNQNIESQLHLLLILPTTPATNSGSASSVKSIHDTIANRLDSTFVPDSLKTRFESIN